jgi:hypothetical protein
MNHGMKPGQAKKKKEKEKAGCCITCLPSHDGGKSVK